MKPSSKGKREAVHKFGPDRREKARLTRRLDPNFKQSRDVHEDRGTIQTKSAAPHFSVGVRRSGATGRKA